MSTPQQQQHAAHVQQQMSLILAEDLQLNIQARVNYHTLCESLQNRLMYMAMSYRHNDSIEHVHRDGVDVGIVQFLHTWHKEALDNTSHQNLHMCKLFMPLLNKAVRHAENEFQMAIANPGIGGGQNGQPVPTPPPDAARILHITTQKYNERLADKRSHNLVARNITLASARCMLRTFQHIATQIIMLEPVMHM